MMNKMVAQASPYGALCAMSLLVMMSGFFVKAGPVALFFWGAIAAACLVFFVCSVARLRRGQSVEAADKLLAVSFIVVLLVGEFGASTESRFSFLVSIWRLLVLLFLCIAVRRESQERYPILDKLVQVPLVTLFVLTIAFMAFSLGVQVLFLHNDNIKGIVRCVTYYGALVASLYCACVLMKTVDYWGTFQTVCRTALLILVALAIIEMLTGFHLPTSWLLSDSPDALLKLEKIGDPSLYITATGPCYNPNNFCLLLAILACLSIPVDCESMTRRCFAGVLFYVTLTVVAMLGSTIISLGMVASVFFWFAATRMKLVGLLGRLCCAFFCMFVVADLFLAGAGYLVGSRAQESQSTIVAVSAGSVETVAGDFSVQLKNYENGGGSMWMRINLYIGEMQAIAHNPAGLGPANIQSYFEENPSMTNLVDPHNWLFEFVMCYGVFSGLLYVGLLIVLTRDLCCLGRTGEFPYAAPLVVGLAGAMAGSFAPSSSDFNALLWVPVVFGVAFVVYARNFSNCENYRVSLIETFTDEVALP